MFIKSRGMVDLLMFSFDSFCFIVAYCDLLLLHQQYSFSYGHWALYREKWPEEVSTWIFCYSDMLFNRFVFSKTHFGWYWWPDKELCVGYRFRIGPSHNYLFNWFNMRTRVAFLQSDRFYSATDTAFNSAFIQRFYFEQQILCDYHFDGGNPQPQIIYTKDIYYQMFVFVWFSMCVTSDIINLFDLF